MIDTKKDLSVGWCSTLSYSSLIKTTNA